MQYINNGRYHFMCKVIDNKIYRIGMGADHGKKPFGL